VTPPPSQVSATSIAQAVWSYTPRSLTDIQSLVAAIQNNNPGAVSDYSDLQYVPVPYYAGQVSLTQVAAFIDNAVRNYGLVNVIANFITNSPYNLWTTNFVTSLAASPYLTNTSLNMLLSNVYMPANYAQFLLYYLAQNYYYNKWIYTITANAPSITFSANATISTSPLIAQSITIASGVTVTCGTRTCFIVTQNFNSQGTIVAYGAIGGTPVTSGAVAGGTGGGGIAIIAVTAALGVVNVAGSPGGNGITLAYSGGVSGAGGGNATAVYSFASANSMLTYILQGVSDWWLLNVVGKAPSSTTPLLTFYGSGGGGASYSSGYVGSGSGGGGGGEAIIYAFNIISGTVNAAGGAGGNSTGYSGGGGGGGGGLVFILYGATSGSVTANVAGGAGGVSSTGTYYGATGASGTAYIAAVTVKG
jgi:hypothetical protein